MKKYDFDPIELFSMYMKVTGIPHIENERAEEAALQGKSVGLIDGATWITLWDNFFGAIFLPGVRFVKVGSDAVQLNFIRADKAGEPCPPQENIDTFVYFAENTMKLFPVDAFLITCSTMNRSFRAVKKALEEYGIPVVQIDEPMMEKAVEIGDSAHIIATHGPTVKNTRSLLEETAARMNRKLNISGDTILEAFEYLAVGDIHRHNELIASCIRKALDKNQNIKSIVLAQLSMTVFLLSYPEPEKKFGIPVLTSGEWGFRRLRDVLSGKAD